ncbi:MAG TPA: hypothetical protein VF749_19000 [Candidatus Acidoferrum sp.]
MSISRLIPPETQTQLFLSVMQAQVRAAGTQPQPRPSRLFFLNANGSGTAGLICGVGGGCEFAIQVDRQRSMFNLVDVDPANPGNFVAGTAIRQEIRDSD